MQRYKFCFLSPFQLHFVVFFLCIFLSSQPCRAQYRFEIAPLIGLNLPYDVWGAENILRVYGLRAAMAIPSLESSAVEAGYLKHKYLDDRATTYEVSYRYELDSENFRIYVNLGFHRSTFVLSPQLNEDGECFLVGCLTDSGTHSGISYGGGFLIPINENQVTKLGFRYYINPQTWLLLDFTYGFRF